VINLKAGITEAGPIARSSYPASAVKPLGRSSITAKYGQIGKQARTAQSDCHRDLQFESVCRRELPLFHF
jgi:hypothetical protein